MGGEFKEAGFWQADLKGARLEPVKLKGDDALTRFMEEELYTPPNLEGASLPDGTTWTPETDMRRFTHPEEYE